MVGFPGPCCGGGANCFCIAEHPGSSGSPAASATSVPSHAASLLVAEMLLDNACRTACFWRVRARAGKLSGQSIQPKNESLPFARAGCLALVHCSCVAEALGFLS